MKSKYTLRDIYGENAVFTSRPSQAENPWMPKDTAQMEFLTAREVIISNIPVLVHKATQTEAVRNLFEKANIPWCEQPYQYETKAEYLAHLNKWQAEGKDIVFQYMHTTEECHPDAYWMDKELFSYLNSKAYIQEIAPEKYIPKRQIVDGSELREILAEWLLPVVLKPADDSPTAGGYGVIICYDEAQLEQGIRRFEDAQTTKIVIEQFIDEAENFCCQYVYNEKIGIQWLGASHQVTDRFGHYAGNISVEEVPPEIIEAGKEIMACGVEKGYVGVAGFDLLWTKDKEIYAIDLNFRQNGSTSMLLFMDTLEQKYLKFLTYTAKSAELNKDMLKIIEQLVTEGVLLPLSMYDGDYFATKQPIRFSGIWLGHSKEQLKASEQRLLQSGTVQI